MLRCLRQPSTYKEKTLMYNGLNVAFRKVEVYYLRVIEKYMTSMGVFRDQFKEMGHPDLKKMKNFGGNMKRFSLLFILVFAVAAFGQEAMEAPAEEMTTDMMADSAAVDTMAMDEMLMEDSPAVEEAVVEEDAGDALEAMLAEEGTMETEVTSGSAMIGYTAGIMGGYPVYLSSGLADGKAAPVFGIIAATPFGFTVGPLEIGLGVELGMYDFTDASTDYSGIVALATLNTALLETSQGALSAEVGGGYYGASVGGTAGATFNYSIPNLPIVLKPYVRANMTLASGDNSIGSVAWVNAGLYVSYDISTLF
jgi:hypothetical protein